MKILVTGSNGLIGQHLVKALNDFGNFEVFGVGRRQSQNCNSIILNLGDDWSIKALPQNIDVVIHLAQSENFRDFPNSSEDVFNVNTLSTLKLLNYARIVGVKKFIYASSGGIYGNGNEEFTEESPISLRNDLGFYLSTKLCSELIVQNYSSFFNIDILRFFFVYGPGQRSDMLIPRLIKSVQTGSEINLQGTNGIKLNPIYVSDAVEAIINCLAIELNIRLNVAGNEVLSLRAICEIIGQHLGKLPNFSIERNEPKNLVADITKMKSLLGTPKVDFRSAIEMMDLKGL